MGHEFGGVGFALALAAPGGVALAVLYAFGRLDGASALAAAAATAGLAVLLAIPLIVSLARAQAAIARLGPEAARAATSR